MPRRGTGEPATAWSERELHMDLDMAAKPEG